MKKFDVYLYYIANDLPSESIVDLYNGVVLNLLIKNKNIFSIEQDENYSRKIKIAIKDNNSFLLPNDYELYYFLYDLLLAFNLNFKESFLAPFKPPFYLDNNDTTSPIKIKNLSSSPSQVQLKNSQNIKVSGKIFSTTIRMGRVEGDIDINETIVLDYMNFITTTNVHTSGFKTDPNHKIDHVWINIKLSLLEYESALSSFIPMIRFKHLFNSLELAINCDGIDRIDDKNYDAFADEVVKITNNANDKSSINVYRKTYNRFKHAVTIKDATQIKTFDNGYLDLFNSLPNLRQICNKVIFNKIKELKNL